MFTVWSMPNCIWCVKVCELLADRGVPFIKDERPILEWKETLLKHGFNTMPQVWLGDTHIGGYQDTVHYLVTKNDA